MAVQQYFFREKEASLARALCYRISTKRFLQAPEQSFSTEMKCLCQQENSDYRDLKSGAQNYYHAH